MEHATPRQLAATGAMTVVMSGLFLLMAVGVIPSDDAALGAPRWAVVAVLVPPLLAGLGLLAKAASRATLGHVLVHAGGAGFVTTMAVFFAWLVVTGRTGTHGTLTIGPVPVPLPPAVARVVNVVVVLVAALMFAFMAVVYWPWFVRSLAEPGRRPPS
jgi:hypothetical protein